MCEIDKRDKLGTEPFTYNVMKDNKVFIYWLGKQVTTLKGEDSEKLLGRLRNAEKSEAQLIMAKVTGNFKRGNEKSYKK